MKKFLIILFFGLLVWVIHFGISMLAEPLKETKPALFQSVIFLTLVASAVFFLVIYFRKSFSGFAGEGLLVGLVWFGICLLLGWLFGTREPGFGQFFLSQGLAFVSIPILSCGFDLIVKRKVW